MEQTKQRIVVKVGTSTLTHESGALDLRSMEHLVRTLADLHGAGNEVILVTSGAIAVGTAKLGLAERPKELRMKQAAAAVGQCRMMHIYDKLFSEYNRSMAQILLTGDDVEDPDRAAHLRSTFSALLEMGVIPVVNENDSVSSAEIETGHHKVLGDNDTLSAIVAELCRADLLVLPTHADDEHLWFGGALPWYAGEKGYAVQVAYMTNHWGEPYRPHELLDGLWTVGIKNYPVISDFPDLYASKASLESAIQVYGEDTVTAWQVQLLRRFTPEVVVAHDINGEYGHGAHQLNARTLLAALDLAADPARYPDIPYGPWQVQKAYLHLWPENTITMEWSQMPLAAFGGRTALEMAQAGFSCHASQTAYFSVKESGSNDCRQFGLAYTTVGQDVQKNDFFENVVWPPEPTPEPTPDPTPTPDPMENLLLEVPATANNEHSKFPAFNINDGVNTQQSRWAAANSSLPMWIEFDFGEGTSFNTLVLKENIVANWASERITGFELQKEDGNTYTTFFTYSGTVGAEKEFSFDVCTTQKLRLVITSLQADTTVNSAGQTDPSLCEVELYYRPVTGA